MKLHWSVAKRLVRLNKSPRVARRLGARWLLDPRDWIDTQLLIGRPYEVPQRAYFADLSRRLRVTRFLDCGANLGLYTVLMAKALPEITQIDAFEPVRETRYRLCANLWLNGLSERVTVHDCGLSDRAGTAEISVDPASTGVSALTPSAEERERRNFAGVQSVRLARLDDVIAAEGARIAIKIDVEGHELSLIAGAERTLQRNVCVVQIETRARNRDDLDAALARLGYTRLRYIGDDAYFVPTAEAVLATAKSGGGAS
jgi:FkbM family methyltransferase